MEILKLSRENKAIVDLAALLERAKLPTAPGNQYESLLLHEVSLEEIELVKKELDIDIKGWKHLIDESGIRHVIRRHTKKNPNETHPLTDEDILLIPEILTQYESLHASRLNRRNMFTLMYCKKIGDTQYYIEYVAEMRSRHKALALNTMYKNPLHPKRKSKTL